MRCIMRERQYKLVIWGMGTLYNRYADMLKAAQAKNEIQIVAITANELPDADSLDGWRVVGKESLKDEHFDYVLVMSRRYFGEIVEEIEGLGIERKKIIPGRIMDISHFQWNSYMEILESNVSIICNNCWGGILYHTLGLECRSPFKNLFVDAEELLHILPDLKQYLSVTPKLSGWETDPHSGQRYPVMSIMNAAIHFNHDTNVDEALAKWKRRCEKVNYANIFVSIYTESDRVVEKFLRLSEYQNKVCFIPRQAGNAKWSNHENIFELDLLPGQKEFWESVNSSVSGDKNCQQFDILSMLHMKKVYRKIG